MKSNHSGSISQAFRVILLIACCCVLTATSVATNQYYVNASGGNDSNDGSQAHPWATINHANAALAVGGAGTCVATGGWISDPSVGACVHVASGTYSGAITTSKSGTAGARIRYVSDSQYGAHLTGSSSGVLWSVTGAFTDVVGFDIDGSVNSGVLNGVGIYASGHHARILSNKAHDIGKACNTRDNGVFVSEATSTSASDISHDNTYDSNLLYHNNCGAHGSTSFGNSLTGILTQQNDIVTNNIIVDLGGGWCIQVTHASTRNIVTNNTLLNCDRGGIRVSNGFGGSVDFSTINNNIIANNGSNGGDDGIHVTSGCGSNNVFKNNVMFGNSPSNYEFSNGCSDTSSGTFSGSNSTTFVNYTGTVNGDYHLKAGTPAIGAGTASCASGVSSCVATVDFDGNVRSLASAFDVGPYQSGVTNAGSAPSPPTGLTAQVQ